MSLYTMDVSSLLPRINRTPHNNNEKQKSLGLEGAEGEEKHGQDDRTYFPREKQVLIVPAKENKVKWDRLRTQCLIGVVSLYLCDRNEEKMEAT